MVDLMIVLLVAHLMGDFVLQPKKLVQMKNRIPGQLLHGFIIFLTCLILIPDIQGLKIALIMGLSHFLIDFGKRKIKKYVDNTYRLNIFIIDQITHLLIIFILILYFGPTYNLSLYLPIRSIFLKIQIIFIGVILNLVVSNLIIVNFFQTYYPDVSNCDGLKGAGKYIGYLERIIIMFMILTGNLTGIGFLITAKSIFRIGKLTSNENIKTAEYIILGTLFSIVLALIFSYLIKYLLQYV